MARKRTEGTRAPNGASSIYVGKDGYWHGRVTVGVKDNGKPDRRHVQAKTEAEVIKKVRQLERERDSGTVRKTGQEWTVEKWLMHWYETIAVPNVRYKTRNYYWTAVNKYIVPGIGAHKLSRLEPEHIERFYARLRKEGAKSATLQQVHIALRASLNEAERRNRITRNPIRAVRAPKIEEIEIEPLTVDDARAILAIAHGRRNGVRWAIALALGLRQGEAIGLKWSDLKVEWHHGCSVAQPCGKRRADDCPSRQVTAMLTVRRALQRQTWQHGCDGGKCGGKRGADCPKRHSGGLVVVEPKSRAGRRVLSVPPPLVLALLEHREAQDVERQQAADVWQDEGWMFAQPTGRPTDPRADYGEWKDVLKAAGVREARLHDARHTAATFLLVLGVAQRAVMDVMGWSKIDMAQRYQHVPDELRQNIASQLGGLLWKGPDEEDDDGPTAAPVPA
ncbi:integrase [Amycolatopsis bartoniae]|uniref:Site-specific integrase n=1 Tax=Amycolatopsis bartoniae TaxID=941986 RepID=A0A8H9IZN2_9PSEU|nr:tyrosine-type recombinase/integrase [Amycolatopsis bartoniae]MBB2935088.1 integrase [Amycolatopsis bartoniae]TVT02562.1 tyrosine-type recombinase/integrase [Amycolatopsis bartoniae]GHF74263.1 site-specific integrase [Amycolatopsis bartoniae]